MDRSDYKHDLMESLPHQSVNSLNQPEKTIIFKFIHDNLPTNERNNS